MECVADIGMDAVAQATRQVRALSILQSTVLRYRTIWCPGSNQCEDCIDLTIQRSSFIFSSRASQLRRRMATLDQRHELILECTVFWRNLRGDELDFLQDGGRIKCRSDLSPRLNIFHQMADEDRKDTMIVPRIVKYRFDAVSGSQDLAAAFCCVEVPRVQKREMVRLATLDARHETEWIE
jgi:hypothetical protein